MPPQVPRDPVEVLLELPREAALADPAGAGDADQASPTLADSRVVQVLHETEFVVPADKRGLERVRPAAAAALGDNPQRTPDRDGSRLAFERFRSGFLEGDGARSRAMGHFA